MIDNLKFFYSGGASNDVPSASLGGVISSVALLIQQGTSPVNITGVTIVSGRANAVGAGTLAYTASGTLLSWAQNGGAAGTAQDVSAGGTFHLKDADGKATLTVTVTAIDLPVADQTDSITISRIANELLDNITGLNGFYGHTDYRCLYIKNTGAVSAAVRVWLGSAVGEATFSIGLDPAGVNGTATTIVNETTAPAGVSFSAPTVAASGLAVTLNENDTAAVWFRRAIVAGEYPAAENQFFNVEFDALEV
jgi:hypothetical protein